MHMYITKVKISYSVLALNIHCNAIDSFKAHTIRNAHLEHSNRIGKCVLTHKSLNNLMRFRDIYIRAVL